MDDVHVIRFLTMMLFTVEIYPAVHSPFQSMHVNFYQFIYTRHQVQISAVTSLIFLKAEDALPSVNMYC